MLCSLYTHMQGIIRYSNTHNQCIQVHAQCAFIVQYKVVIKQLINAYIHVQRKTKYNYIIWTHCIV